MKTTFALVLTTLMGLPTFADYLRDLNPLENQIVAAELSKFLSITGKPVQPAIELCEMYGSGPVGETNTNKTISCNIVVMPSGARISAYFLPRMKGDEIIYVNFHSLSTIRYPKAK